MCFEVVFFSYIHHAIVSKRHRSCHTGLPDSFIQNGWNEPDEYG